MFGVALSCVGPGHIADLACLEACSEAIARRVQAEELLNLIIAKQICA